MTDCAAAAAATQEASGGGGGSPGGTIGVDAGGGAMDGRRGAVNARGT